MSRLSEAEDAYARNFRPAGTQFDAPDEPEKDEDDDVKTEDE